MRRVEVKRPSLRVVHPCAPPAILFELQRRHQFKFTLLCISFCGLSGHSWSAHAHMPFHSLEGGQPTAVQRRGPGGGRGGGGEIDQ